MLEFDKTEQNNVVVLTLKGNLNSLTCLSLKPVIDELVSAQKDKIVFNLKELDLIDSSGIGAIVSLFKQIRQIGGDVKIAGLANQPKEIFRLLNFDKVFDIFESNEAATSKF